MIYLLKYKIKEWDVESYALVRADSEDEARNILTEKRHIDPPGIWLDPSKSSCEEFDPFGESEILIQFIR